MCVWIGSTQDSGEKGRKESAAHILHCQDAVLGSLIIEKQSQSVVCVSVFCGPMEITSTPNPGFMILISSSLMKGSRITNNMTYISRLIIKNSRLIFSVGD